MARKKIDPKKVHFDEDSVVEDVDLEQEAIYVEGQRLTEERADQRVGEVLAQVRARNLVPGGKSLSGDGKHSPVVQVRVSEATHAGLQQLAEARKASVSRLARQALEDSVGYFVCWEQQFDGGEWELVRLNKSLPMEQAQLTFHHFVRIGRSHGYRSVQIRRGRDEIVEEWRAGG